MTKKSSRSHKNKNKDTLHKQDIAAPATKGIKTNWKLAVALFCALSVFVPWMLEAVGVHIPRGIEKASTSIGVLGLIVLLATVLTGRR